MIKKHTEIEQGGCFTEQQEVDYKDAFSVNDFKIEKNK